MCLRVNLIGRALYALLCSILGVLHFPHISLCDCELADRVRLKPANAIRPASCSTPVQEQ